MIVYSLGILCFMIWASFIVALVNLSNDILE